MKARQRHGETEEEKERKDRQTHTFIILNPKTSAEASHRHAPSATTPPAPRRHPSHSTCILQTPCCLLSAHNLQPQRLTEAPHGPVPNTSMGLTLVCHRHLLELLSGTPCP